MSLFSEHLIYARHHAKYFNAHSYIIITKPMKLEFPSPFSKGPKQA